MSHKSAMPMNIHFIDGFTKIGELLSRLAGEAMKGANALSQAAAAVFALWRARRRQRRELRSMDGHMLRDIGLTRPRALTEAYKPFWRA